MIVTTTAVAFITLAAGLTACGVLFLNAFRRSGGLQNASRTGFLLSLIFLAFGLQNGAMGFGMLLFPSQPEMLYFVLILNHFLLGIISVLTIYTANYIFSPQTPRKITTLAISLFALFTFAATIATHPKPFLTDENGIDFGMNFILSVAVFYLLTISIGSTMYIFIQLYRKVTDKNVRRLAFIISAAAFFGVAHSFIRLILLYGSDATIRTSLYDTGMGLIGLVFISALLISPFIKKILAAKDP